MAQEGVAMERLTEWIGEGEDRYAVPRMDLRKNGHQKCCDKLAEYEDLEEAGIIQKWIPVNGEFHGLFSYTTKVIVAWMPLPKPYKKGGSND